MIIAHIHKVSTGFPKTPHQPYWDCCRMPYSATVPHRKKLIWGFGEDKSVKSLHSLYCYDILKPDMRKMQQVLSYYAVFDPAEEGGYNIWFPSFPGCVTFGRTFEEARAMARDVLELWMEELTARKQKIPRYALRPLVDEVRVRMPLKQ